MECFISVLHEMLGDIFDLKEFYDSYPKIMTEFARELIGTSDLITGQDINIDLGTLHYQILISLQHQEQKGQIKL